MSDNKISYPSSYVEREFNGQAMNTLAQTQTVFFYEQELIAVDFNSECYVAIRQIVEGIGLEWSRQAKKLNENKEKFNCVHMYTVANDGKNREMLCIPLRKLNGWLFSINPAKVNVEIRDAVVRYQEECFQVLYDHWRDKNAPATAPEPTPAASSFALKEQVELEFVVATQAAALLRMDESSKLLMTRQICESHGLSPKFLPGYVDEMSTKALTVLLKEHAYDLSARKVNETLLDLELLEVRTRPSTKTEGKIKKFKSLTDEGLRFGKNLISPQNPKETQPHFFDNEELFDEMMSLVQAHLQKPTLRLIQGGAA